MWNAIGSDKPIRVRICDESRTSGNRSSTNGRRSAGNTALRTELVGQLGQCREFPVALTISSFQDESFKATTGGLFLSKPNWSQVL